MTGAELWLTTIAQTFGPAGMAWVAVKVALNGTRERVKNIEANTKETNDGVQVLRERFHNHEARLFMLEEGRKEAHDNDPGHSPVPPRSPSRSRRRGDSSAGR